MGSFSIWHWLIVLLIVMLIFGTKKLKNIGSDLGGAVKGFKDGMKDGSAPAQDPNTAGAASAQSPQVSQNGANHKSEAPIDVEVKHKS